MPRVKIYSTAQCALCTRAKTMLDKWAIPYAEIRIDGDAAAMREFAEVTRGARTVPQIFIDDRLVGGFAELTELHMDGELDELMQSE